jgi:hypothetical protein
LKEDRRRVVKRAWGLSHALRNRRENVLLKLIPSGSEAIDGRALIQSQDLEHQRETPVSNREAERPEPMVDSQTARDAEG